MGYRKRKTVFEKGIAMKTRKLTIIIIICILLIQEIAGFCVTDTADVTGFVLSDEEKAYVESAPIMYVAIDNDSFPIEYYVKHEKEYEGVIHDVLYKVSGMTGIEFRYLYAKDTDETLQYAKNLQADIVTTVIQSDQMVLEYGLRSGKVLLTIPTQTGNDEISILYTSRVPDGIVALINRAVDTIPADEISGILALNARSYREMFDNTKVNLVLLISSSFVAVMIIITITVTYERYKKLKMRFLHTDQLTGYSNIAGMKAITDKEVDSQIISSYCMLNLTVANIEHIREIYGYLEGDKVMAEMAVMLDEMIFNRELVAKASSDDFMLLLQFTEKPELVIRINGLIDKVNEKYALRKSEYSVILSIGIYLPKYEETNMEILMQKSLQARRYIKEKDEVRYIFYDETIRITTVEQNALEQEFKPGMAKDEFLIYIQPKVSIADGKICGGEILSRWRNPRRGLIRPGEYIPVFEKSDLIRSFDMYMYEKACQLLAASKKADRTVMPVSINFSRIHFTDIGFCEDLKKMADTYGVPTSLLNIEVTESIMAENDKIMTQIIIRLKEYGFAVSLDDFGTGYASFTDIARFDIDYLKLDRKMIYSMTDQKVRKMIKGIADIAHSMDMKIICEGIETKEQADQVKALDCDIIQGYYYYPPIPYDEYENILKSAIFN